jgi:hypothetical protein
MGGQLDFDALALPACIPPKSTRNCRIKPGQHADDRFDIAPFTKFKSIDARS